jgi:hypothetical protein
MANGAREAEAFDDGTIEGASARDEVYEEASGGVGTWLSLVLWERQRTSAGSLPQSFYGKTSRASREMSAFLVDTVGHGDAGTCR